MNVRVRVASGIREDITRGAKGALEMMPELILTVYATKELAERAQQQLGGIVLDVAASCLAANPLEFGKDVLLISEERSNEVGPSSAYISVCYDGFPYQMVPNYGPYEPGTVEPQGEVADFGPEADAWLENLEKETGFQMHQ